MFRLQITSLLHIHADDVASGGKFHKYFDGFTPVTHKDGGRSAARTTAGLSHRCAPDSTGGRR